MSHGVNIHDGTGVIARDPAGILLSYGTSVPTGPGYHPGAIFLDIDAAAGATAKINEGTLASASFVTFKAAQGAALTAAHATLTQAGTDSGDVAIQALVQNTGFGFVLAAEGEAVIACVLNAMVRLGEIEARLEAAGIIAAN